MQVFAILTPIRANFSQKIVNLSTFPLLKVKNRGENIFLGRIFTYEGRITLLHNSRTIPLFLSVDRENVKSPYLTSWYYSIETISVYISVLKIVHKKHVNHKLLFNRYKFIVLYLNSWYCTTNIQLFLVLRDTKYCLHCYHNSWYQLAEGAKEKYYAMLI